MSMRKKQFAQNKFVHVFMWMAALMAVAWSPAKGQTVSATLTGVGQPVAVAVNPITNTIYLANAQGLTVIDGATGAVTFGIPAGTAPNAVAVNPVTNKIYVLNNGSHNVTVIDGKTLTPNPVPIPVGGNPFAIAINSITNQIYVANSSSASVTVIDGNGVNSPISVTTGGTPFALAVNPVTNKIYVANETGGSVTIINGSDNTTTSVTAGSFPVAVAVNPVTNKIYVANFGGGNVTIIDAANNNNTSNVLTGGSNPSALAVNPVTNKIYVTNNGSKNVTVINAANSNTTSIVLAGLGPSAVAVNPVNNTIYVANKGSGDVTVIDGTTDTAKTVNPLPAGTTPVAIGVNPVTNKIYVANKDSNTVTLIDGASNAATSVQVGNGPLAVDANPVTNKIYVANSSDSTVTIIDGATNTPNPTAVAVSTNPHAVAVNAITNKIYVAGLQAATVTVIDGITNAPTNITLPGITCPCAGGPQAVAVNTITNKIYVASGNSNTVTVIDGGTGATTPVTVGTNPIAVAVNPVTNLIYVANNGNATVTVIDGVTNKTTNVPVGTSPQSLTVNTLTNHIYVADLGGNEIDDIDGATNAVKGAVPSALNSPFVIAVDPANSQIWVANNGSGTATEFTPNFALSPINILVGQGPDGLAVNPVTDKIYISNFTDNTISVIDGASNTRLTSGNASAPATITAGNRPGYSVVNPITNQIYVLNYLGGNVTVIAEQNVQAIPLTTTISPAASNQPGSSTLTFTFTTSNTFAPTAPAVQNVYYQLDTWQGTWTAATGTAPNFSGTITAQPGSHVLYAFATDGQEATSIGQAQSLIGQIAAHPFTVIPAPSVQLSSTTLTFGAQLVGAASAPQTITLTNSGNGTLAITSIALSGTNPGDFMETNNCGTSVAAGANCTLTITFQPTATGARAATVTITDSAANSPQTISLSGSGVATAPTAVLNVTSMTFGSLVVGTASPAQTATLTNNGNAALSITGITVTGANASDFTETGNCGTSLAIGASCTLNVTFKPTATGARTATVTVADNAANTPQTLSLTGTGTPATPGASLSVTSLSFGNVGIGTTSPAQTATLTNNGTAALNITSIAVTGTNAGDFAQTNNCGTSVPVSAKCTISVTFTPGAAGARSASVTVTDNASGSPQTISLSGTGVAAAPTASLNGTSLSFGTTYVGVAATAQTITLTNSGTAALNITSIAVTGTNSSDFAQTNTCGTSVAISAKCAISVTFTPGGTGARLASVTITDNASGSPQSISLGGAGIAASLAMASGSSATQTVKAGQTATYGLQFTATGGAAPTDQISATITCTGAPTQSTCNAPAAAVVATPATPGAFQISVKTTGSVTAMMEEWRNPDGPLPFTTRTELTAIFTSLLCFVLLGWKKSPALRLRAVHVSLSACLVLLPLSTLFLAGCSGGAATPPSPTPAGTYTLTVTATVNGKTQSLPLTLVVQ